MLRKSTTFVSALALGLLLAAAPASAAPQPGDLLGSLRGAFSSLWLRLGGVWGEMGGGMDPNGQPARSPKAIWGEIGVQIDPLGQPAQTPAPPPGEIGVDINPNG